VPRGGPDGGDGGRGGSILARCVDGLNTLIDYRYQQHFKAQSGRPGAGRNRAGPSGSDIILKLPVGTQILNEDGDIILADLTEVGQEIVLAGGGDGGRGNAAFKTSTNQAPRRADTGFPGMGMWIWLQLKLIADAGLVGLPNAGKSTFLAASSAARPKIANYPFTTLHPGLGVVSSDDHEFVLADIPGLVEGAHEGIGLGHRFLGHVERCQVLVHLVDGTDDNPVKNWKTVRDELDAYNPKLTQKREITAVSKIDAINEDRLVDIMADLKVAGATEVTALSAVAGTNMPETLRNLYTIIEQSRDGVDEAKKTSMPWQP
jgi:GTP-binding protein